MTSQNAYPSTLIESYIEKKGNGHVKRVEEYKMMIAKRRADEKQAEEDKIRAKQERKAKRIADAKAAQIAKLREQIEEKFVKKAAPVEEILKQTICELDGCGKTEPVVTAMGSFLG